MFYSENNFITLVNLVPLTNYTLYVTAVEKSGKESKRKSITVMTMMPDPTIPEAPVNLFLTNQNFLSYKLEWEAPKIDGYSPIISY